MQWLSGAPGVCAEPHRPYGFQSPHFPRSPLEGCSPGSLIHRRWLLLRRHRVHAGRICRLRSGAFVWFRESSQHPRLALPVARRHGRPAIAATTPHRDFGPERLGLWMLHVPRGNGTVAGHLLANGPLQRGPAITVCQPDASTGYKAVLIKNVCLPASLLVCSPPFDCGD